jgi:16S rRNA (uracil1498-N3)-methyltransferase
LRPAPRLHVDAPLGQGGFAFDDAQARYLGSVLRLREGDEVRLFNVKSGEWTYAITAMGKRNGQAEPVEQRRLPIEEAKAPILLFAPIKRTPLEVLVQKATELGAVRLQPVVTERTNRENLRLDRLMAIATEASEQCERLSVPTLHPPAQLALALAPLQAFVFCDEAGDDEQEPWGGEEGRAGTADHIFGKVSDVPEAVLIGPEGGFTPEERAKLRADPRALPISLGPRILRAETAAIVALTLWQTRFGDLR